MSPNESDSSQSEKKTESRTHDQKIDALRQRLYARGKQVDLPTRHTLTNQRKGIEKDWEIQPAKVIDEDLEQVSYDEGSSDIPVSNNAEQSLEDSHSRRAIDTESSVPDGLVAPTITKPPEQPSPAPVQQVAPVSSEPQMFKSSKRRNYIRSRISAAAFIFFIVALVLSAAFFFFGQNTISGDNISIDVNGPFVIGGGEELNLQIAVSNQNVVPIEAATLIVEYPSGTQSATELGKELTRERKSLDVIRSGEVLNIPAQAVVFGEENEEKTVFVSVEYRVKGSNASFEKKAEPFRFKISSSPVVIAVDAVKEITSGQELALELRIASNSAAPVTDILVMAEYPFGFDYSDASMDPVSGQNIWRIDRLEPEETKTITISGLMTGESNVESVFDFKVGVATERDEYALASIFSVARTEVKLDEAFIKLDVEINEQRDDVVAVPREPGTTVVAVTFTNTLSSTLYDVEVDAVVEGNALSQGDISVKDGFYNSNNNIVNWNWRDIEDLERVLPGESRRLTFRLSPTNNQVRTPQIQISVSAKGKRVSDAKVPETLTDSETRIVKYESNIDLDSLILYSTGPFVNTGPPQPVAGRVTQYTFVLSVENGSNDITDAVVTATIPNFVTWLDLVTADNTVRYDISGREITWDIGDMEAGGKEQVAFQMTVLPSVSQVSSVPTILNSQNFKATDRFTGTVIRTSSPALTTQLLQDPNITNEEGRVLEELPDDD